MWHVPLFALATRWLGDKRVRLGLVKHTKENVLFVKELVEAGRYRPVIDATRYVETGQKAGNVVLTLDGIGPDTREDVGE